MVYTQEELRVYKMLFFEFKFYRSVKLFPTNLSKVNIVFEDIFKC